MRKGTPADKTTILRGGQGERVRIRWRALGDTAEFVDKAKENVIKTCAGPRQTGRAPYAGPEAIISEWAIWMGQHHRARGGATPARALFSRGVSWCGHARCGTPP